MSRDVHVITTSEIRIVPVRKVGFNRSYRFLLPNDELFAQRLATIPQPSSKVITPLDHIAVNDNHRRSTRAPWCGCISQLRASNTILSLAFCPEPQSLQSLKGSNASPSFYTFLVNSLEIFKPTITEGLPMSQLQLICFPLVPLRLRLALARPP
ncbi:hypothetical protein Lal_00018525, partial [Lupinus albus]